MPSIDTIASICSGPASSSTSTLPLTEAQPTASSTNGLNSDLSSTNQENTGSLTDQPILPSTQLRRRKNTQPSEEDGDVLETVTEGFQEVNGDEKSQSSDFCSHESVENDDQIQYVFEVPNGLNGMESSEDSAAYAYSLYKQKMNGHSDNAAFPEKSCPKQCKPNDNPPHDNNLVHSHGDSSESAYDTFEEPHQYDEVDREGFASYLWSELSRGYVPDENEAVYNVKKERVYAFLRIPKECEKFMFWGLLQCIDSFLFIFTFLPLRLLIILVKCLARPWSLVMPQTYLSSSQKCDLVKGIILALSCVLMTHVDASMLYHLIRGQAMIKLYIFFNLLEIGDRLLSSFGQDILDALMWTVADSRKQSYLTVCAHVFTGVVYVFIHSILVLLQASALNVAFNSHNKALLTILISNNAVELKGSVFKKFEKTNLFQMACSDVRERFHFQVLIFIVIIRNMTDFNWDPVKFWELVPDIIILNLSETFVDITKHAFITKFNNIPSKVYREYTALLANDVITSRKKNAFSDVSDQVSRRLGLIPLPLTCLVIKIVYQCVKVQTPLAWLNAVLAFLCLLGAKMVMGVVVYGWAVDYYNQYHWEYNQEQAKKGRTRHKSGIDADLLKVENNYHWKKPVTVKPAVSTNPEVRVTTPDGSVDLSATTDTLAPSP